MNSRILLGATLLALSCAPREEPKTGCLITSEQMAKYPDDSVQDIIAEVCQGTQEAKEEPSELSKTLKDMRNRALKTLGELLALVVVANILAGRREL